MDAFDYFSTPRPGGVVVRRGRSSHSSQQARVPGFNARTIVDWARRRAAAQQNYRDWNRAAGSHEAMYNEPPHGQPPVDEPDVETAPPTSGRKITNRYFVRNLGSSKLGMMERGRTYKPSPLLYKGIQIDLQESRSQSGTRVQYFGHYTHPHKAVIGSICAAMSKQLGYMACRETPSSLQQRFCSSLGTSAGYRIEIRYRNEPSDTAVVAVTSVNVSDSFTYMDVGNLIRDLLYTVFTNTANTQDVYLDTISLHNFDETVTVGYIVKAQPVIIKFADIKVLVSSSSRLKYQNITLSDSAGSADRHDVEANPLEGIEYNFNGSRNALRHSTLGSSQGVLTVTGNTGIGSFDSTTFADATVDTILESRPNPRVWSTHTTARSVKLSPGVLGTSVLTSTKKLGFQRWFRIYARAMQSTAGVDTGPAEKTSIGRSRWFAMDKMIHDSGDGSTILNLEVELKMKAVIEIRRRKTATAPYNSLS